MREIPKPVRVSDYLRVFLPAPQVYDGPDGVEVRKNTRYERWVPNDHTFVVGPDGRIHLFGITHPETSPEQVHDGEFLLCHGICPGDPFRRDSFLDCGNLLAPDERPGDRPEIHSPAVVRREGFYRMIYGPQEFRQLVSPDLVHWKRGETLFGDSREGNSRDPQILQVGGTWFLCYCKGNSVMLAESSDFIRWSKPRTLLELPRDIAPESPFLYHREGVFYLFVCLWNPALWSGKDIAGAYQSETLVFAADAALDFSHGEILTKIDSHAPEIFEFHGRIFLSSAEYPLRGISLAEMDFL